MAHGAGALDGPLPRRTGIAAHATPSRRASRTRYRSAAGHDERVGV